MTNEAPFNHMLSLGLGRLLVAGEVCYYLASGRMMPARLISPFSPQNVGPPAIICGLAGPHPAVGVYYENLRRAQPV
jgi:hypothetical protein